MSYNARVYAHYHHLVKSCVRKSLPDASTRLTRRLSSAKSCYNAKNTCVSKLTFFFNETEFSLHNYNFKTLPTSDSHTLPSRLGDASVWLQWVNIGLVWAPGGRVISSFISRWIPKKVFCFPFSFYLQPPAFQLDSADKKSEQLSSAAMRAMWSENSKAFELFFHASLIELSRQLREFDSSDSRLFIFPISLESLFGAWWVNAREV